MNFKTINPISSHLASDKHEGYSFSASDLPHIIEKLKEENFSIEENLSAIIFFKNQQRQVLLTAFREGAKFNSFQSNHSMIFQVMEGRIGFNTSKESVMLEKGQQLTLMENIAYGITSYEDTLLLLIIETGI